MYILYLKPTNDHARSLYETAAAAYNARIYQDRDAGFDLFCRSCVVPRLMPHVSTKIFQQTQAAFYDTEKGIFRAYWMLPRSSISKTPMILANSVGLIDAGYRGEIIAAVHNLSDATLADFKINAGDRYFQLSSPDLLPWDRVMVVDEIPGGPTLRGEGGFGSTNLSGATPA